jgi:hypothetical protein
MPWYYLHFWQISWAVGNMEVRESMGMKNMLDEVKMLLIGSMIFEC